MKTLYRAAADDLLTDCGAFAETLETARVYLDNPGFGGARLWETQVDESSAKVLDLRGHDTAYVAELVGARDPGSIGVDEYVPRVSYELRGLGWEWVLVDESHPAGTTTWIWVGGDDPEMVEVGA